MHKNIIEYLKTFFKENNNENININDVINDNCCVEKYEVLDKRINKEGSNEHLIQLTQNLVVTPNQLRVLEKLAKGSVVNLNLKKDLLLY